MERVPRGHVVPRATCFRGSNRRVQGGQRRLEGRPRAAGLQGEVFAERRLRPTQTKKRSFAWGALVVIIGGLLWTSSWATKSPPNTVLRGQLRKLIAMWKLMAEKMKRREWPCKCPSARARGCHFRSPAIHECGACPNRNLLASMPVFNCTHSLSVISLPSLHHLSNERSLPHCNINLCFLQNKIPPVEHQS